MKEEKKNAANYENANGNESPASDKPAAHLDQEYNHDHIEPVQAEERANSNSPVGPVEPAPSDEENSSQQASADVSEYGDDPEVGGDFTAYPVEAGEIAVPLCKLQVAEWHPGMMSRTSYRHQEGLSATAINPSLVKPLLVMDKGGEGFVIIDGRLRYLAFLKAHGASNVIAIRCVLFGGSEAKAVQLVSDEALGVAPRTKIEQAFAINALQQHAGITQVAIADRYHALNKDQVSRYTIAARTVMAYPEIFSLLEKPDKVSIDTCVKFNQHVKGLDDEELGELLERAEGLASSERPIKGKDLLIALKIESGLPADVGEKTLALSVVSSEVVTGEDDEPIGAVEMLSDNATRLRLPDPLLMSPSQREEAAESFIKQIRRHFGLDNG